MSEDIKNFIHQYVEQRDAYVDAVPSNSENLRNVNECLDRMRELGERLGEIGPFMSEAVPLMHEVSSYLSALAMEGHNAKPKATPSISQYTEPYHRSFAEMDASARPETAGVYRRIFALEEECTHIAEFLHRMADEGLFVKMATVPLAEVHEQSQAELKELRQPVAMREAQEVAAAARASTSAIEVEYEAERIAALSQIETQLDQLLIQALYQSIGLHVSGYRMNPSDENRQKVEAGCRFVAELYGLLPEDVLAIPRVQEYVEANLLYDYEEKRFRQSYESYVSETLGTIKKCLSSREPLSAGESHDPAMHFWGKNYRVQDASRVLASAPRPDELTR